MPLQDVHFALVGPVVRIGNQSVAHGIITHIIPLCAIAIAFAQLGIPAVDLLDGVLIGVGP